MEPRIETIKPCGINAELVAKGGTWFALPAGATIVAQAESEFGIEHLQFETLKDITFQLNGDTPVRGLTVEPRCVLIERAGVRSDQPPSQTEN